MSRVIGDEKTLDSDTELGAAISACYIDRINEDQAFSTEDQAVTIEEVVRAGLKDPEYTALKAAIQQGFPEKKEECPPILTPYYNHRINITVVSQNDQEFLVFNDSKLKSRMIIPKALRNKVKKILHADHRRRPHKSQTESCGTCVLAKHGSRTEIIH